MSNSIKNDLDHKADILLSQRAVEPDVSDLAEKIIFASQNLPQDLAKTGSRSVWGQLFGSKLRSFAYTGAIACLMLAVMSGVWFVPQSVDIESNSLLQETGFEGDALSEEFSWEGLLIMQEELAFAEL